MTSENICKVLVIQVNKEFHLPLWFHWLVHAHVEKYTLFSLGFNKNTS